MARWGVVANAEGAHPRLGGPAPAPDLGDLGIAGGRVGELGGDVGDEIVSVGEVAPQIPRGRRRGGLDRRRHIAHRAAAGAAARQRSLQ